MPQNEVADFLGDQSSNRNPVINACQEMLNLDLRSKYGDMVLREGTDLLYALPTHPRLANVENLSMSSFFAPKQYNGGREITVCIQKGTVNPEVGSGATTTKNILALWVRPYWKKIAEGTITGGTNPNVNTYLTGLVANQYVGNWLVFYGLSGANFSSYASEILSHTGGIDPTIFTCRQFPVQPSNYFEIWGWSDEWQWINETIISKITDINITGGDTNAYQGVMNIWLADQLLAPNNLSRFTARHLSDGVETLVIGDQSIEVDDHLDPNLHQIATAFSANTWNIGDEILLMRNHIPLAYLEQMYFCDSADITYHTVLNELKIGFGGLDNRLALNIGFRLKSLQLGSYNIPLAAFPYLPLINQLSMVFGLILDPYNAITDSGCYDETVTAFGSGDWINKKYFYYLVTYIDNFNIFCIKAGNVVADNNSLNLFLFVNPAQLNKRTTGFELYISESELTDTDATGLYFLAYSTMFNRDHYDNIANTFSFDTDGKIVYVGGGLSYATYNLNKTKDQLDLVLGYTPTLVYANSWDFSIAPKDGRILFISPDFAGERINNKLFYSPTSGAGAFQYDVLTAQKYYDFELFDGNDIIGISVLENLNFILNRANSYQIIDSASGASIKSVYGFGCISRRSIINFGSHVAWCGQDDIYMADTNSDATLSDKTIRMKYRDLSLAYKQNIIAVREGKDNAYRFFTGDTVNKTEFLYTKKGWITQAREDYPIAYVNAKDGSVYYLSSVGILKPNLTGTDYLAQVPFTTGISFKWRSVPIDVSLLGQANLGSDLLNLLTVWLSFLAPDLQFKIYLDGVLELTLPISAVTSKNVFVQGLPLGMSCKYFEIEFSGKTPDTGINFVNFYSLGWTFNLLERGVFGT